MMTAPRVLLLNPDGTAEVGGVKVRVVPDEPVAWLHPVYLRSRQLAMDATPMRLSEQQIALYSAAAIDLSGLPVVPERITDLRISVGYRMGFAAALDAIGVTK